MKLRVQTRRVYDTFVDDILNMIDTLIVDANVGLLGVEFLQEICRLSELTGNDLEDRGLASQIVLVLAAECHCELIRHVLRR